MSIVTVILHSVADGLPLGAAGIGLGIIWDRIALRRGWRGWHWPTIEREN